jgi:HEAT repeat protein
MFSSAAGGTEPDLALVDELTLKGAGLATDAAGLAAFFRNRSQPACPRERLVALVRQLSDESPEKRDRAAVELIGIGPAAVPWVRQLLKDPDAIDAAAQARRCLRALEGKDSIEIVTAAVRLLARRHPADIIPILLAYLPYADNDSVLEEIKTALAGVAYRDGQPDPALLEALEDDRSLRRAVAIDVLCEAGTAEPRPTLRRLLKDPKAIVRMHAGLALAQVREPEAVATLIALLGELPTTYGKRVEEYLLTLAGDQAPKVELGATPESRRQCQAAWGAWWKASDDSKLLDELRKRSMQEAEKDKVLALVQKLGDDVFSAREQAQNALLSMGIAVVPVLRQAVNDPDLEIRTRAAVLLAQIEKDRSQELSPVTLRLIAFRKPPGSAEALLAYLSATDEENAREEVQETLNALAFLDGKANPLLVAALADKKPLWRAAAAEALCQPGAVDQQAAVRALLRDPDAAVRVRAALALAGVRDRNAVPVLIAGLGELTPEQSGRAEEYLQSLAGDQAPVLKTSSDAADPKKRRDVWLEWWKNKGDKIEMVAWNRAALRQPYYGYTLIGLPQNGQIMELGTDSKVRWQMNGLSQPMDFQVLPGNRVLVAESGGSRVTERNFKGEILWQKQANYPIGCQRLPNGNTFIVTRNQLLEVDRSGKELFTLNRNFNDIMAAQKLRDGKIVMATQAQCIYMDAAGKELRSFGLPNGMGTNYIEALSKGHVLIPQIWNNKVYEHDPDGKVIWEATVQQPQSASRLPNGNTLIALQSWPAKVIELDKTGKQVWEYQPPSQAGRVKRR